MTITILKPLTGLLDSETRSCAQHTVRSGRSWWAVRMGDPIDDWVHEWDPDPGSPNKHMDWPRLKKRGRQAIRLYCPNGKFAQLGDTHDATGKLFEFKVGLRRTVTGIGIFEESDTVLAHVVGMVHGLIGECTMFSWEILPPPEIPLDSPKPPDEREWIAKSAEPGLYEAAVARWQVDISDYEKTRQYQEWAKRFQLWERNAKGRLVGPIDDNVYGIRYHNIGKLNADHLGIDDGEGR